DGGSGYAPTALAIKARELVLGGRRLTNVVAGLSEEGRLWRGNIDAEQLNGYVEYRPSRRPGVGAGRVYARLSRLSLPTGDADSGAFLERLGGGRVVKGGKGSLSGQVAWLGSPVALDYPSLAGQVNVAIDSGQFLKVQPGAARLLSVLSLQSLPRRLALDFRD